jgi:SET domain-containing protein
MNSTLADSRIDNILRIKESDVHGKGLFSNNELKTGQTITAICGEIINADECVRRESEGNVYIFWKNDDVYIDVSSQSVIKFINHSCDYNCDIDEDENGNLILFSTKNIQEGEELTIDYGYEEIYESCSCNQWKNKKELFK